MCVINSVPDLLPHDPQYMCIPDLQWLMANFGSEVSLTECAYHSAAPCQKEFLLNRCDYVNLCLIKSQGLGSRFSTFSPPACSLHLGANAQHGGRIDQRIESERNRNTGPYIHLNCFPWILSSVRQLHMHNNFPKQHSIFNPWILLWGKLGSPAKSPPLL